MFVLLVFRVCDRHLAVHVSFKPNELHVHEWRRDIGMYMSSPPKPEYVVRITFRGCHGSVPQAFAALPALLCAVLTW